jgi:hypothetical protein
MTDKKKLVKCYYLQVFDPPTRAPHLVAANIQAQGLANILHIGDCVGLLCHRDGIVHIHPSLSVFVVGVPSSSIATFSRIYSNSCISATGARHR